MPPKKEKKKLTDEEKLVLAEQQALAAAELAQKKSEVATKFLKEKLQMEEKNSKINLSKINQQWRQILRKVKAEQLKNDIDALRQGFERIVDRKQNTIRSLLVDSLESDHQSARAFQAHLKNMDSLMAFQEKLMLQVQEEFNTELEELKNEFATERKKIIKQHEEEMNDLKDILFVMKIKFDDHTDLAQNELSNKIDDLRSKNMEARTQLKHNLEAIITELWELFQQALRNYELSTKDKKAEFEVLKNKDRKSAALGEKHVRKLARLHEQIQSYKQSLQIQKDDFEEQNKALKREKETILIKFQHLKAEMSVNRDAPREALTRLTVESKQTVDKLKSRLAKATSMLKLADSARRLETQEEKVLPFYADSISPQEVSQAEETEQISFPGVPQAPSAANEGFSARALTFSGEPVEPHAALSNFWKRYNKSLLDKLAAERQQQDLEAENQRLRGILKQYLDGVSVSEDVLRQDNTLFIVNGRTNLPANPVRGVPVGDKRVDRQGGLVIIDAAVELHHQRLMAR